MECDTECNCCDKYPLQLLAWVLAFLMWYEIFVIFIGFVSEYGPVVDIVVLVLFNGAWILTMTSLFWSSLMTIAPIPSRFDAPPALCALKRNDGFFELLADYGENHKNLDCQYAEIKLDKGTRLRIPRLCDQCKKFKPRRTHHCSTCKGCVPRMDHHCPVIGNCIHHHNHKGFMLFLFWATVVCTIAVIVISPRIVSFFRQVADEPSSLIKELVDVFPVLISITGMTNGLVCGIALSVFQYIQMGYVVKNETQLESGNSKVYNYSKGSVVENIKVVFGPDPYYWLFPTATTEGDGYTFPFPGDDLPQTAGNESDAE